MHINNLLPSLCAAHNNPDQLLDILKQLLAGKGDDKQKSKKVKGHGRDEDEPLGSHLVSQQHEPT